MNKDFGFGGGGGSSTQESFKDFSLVKKLDSILGAFRYLPSAGPVNIVAFDIIVTAATLFPSLKAQLRLESSRVECKSEV